MRKARFLILLGLCVLSTHLGAVPARSDWQVITQPDGTTIELRTVGDEFYHYWINRDGEEVTQNADGYWVVVPEQLTATQRNARRMASPQLKEVEEMRKAPVSPLPTRMLVILVSFSDRAMDAAHNSTYFDDWLNGTNHEPYGSVWEYFNTTSDGKYSPHWDVVGPVTLDNTMEYYGGNDESGEDLRPRQMAFEACEKADALGCDFSLYDADDNGYVDNVYIIYAGYSESSCSRSWPNSVWPHSWSMGSYATHKIDGKKLNNYACSAELNNCSGNETDGIGTFCHEFSHTLGLPDYYDTQHGENNSYDRTPGDWSLMDQGSYNGNGHRPPLYSIFDKCYMGWASMPPVLPKDANMNISMPVGTQYARHITGTTSAKNYTSTDTIYYLENRQQEGKFDGALPGHGLLIWQVLYRSSWNKPNNEAGVLRYTLLSATGNINYIGTKKDPYPGYNKVTKKTVWPGCELNAITESNEVISFRYNKGAHETVTREESFQIAQGQSYSWRGRKLNTPGDYYDTARTEYGDTIITLTLSYVDPAKTIIYTGPNQLDEVTNISVLGQTLYINCGLHTDAFDQAIALHYFSNGIGTVIFKDTLRTIGDYAFYGCRKGNSSNQINTLTLPYTVTSIGNSAFYCCYETTAIDLGTSVKTIGEKALYKCYALKNLVLPESVTKLNKYALQKCTTLVSITSEALIPPTCYSSTFSGITKSNITLSVYPVSLNKYKVADEWKDFFMKTIACDEPTLLLTNDTICEGGSYAWRGKQLFAAGLYSDTLISRYGCDSAIHSLQLMVAPVYSYQDSAYVCYGDTYPWHNRSLTQTGIYHDSLTTIYGCDSVYTFLLTVGEPATQDTLKQTIYEGESFAWRGADYTQEGTYMDTTYTAQGCYAELHWLELLVLPNLPTAVNNYTTEQPAIRKYISGGRLYIERNGIRYNATGNIIKR